VIEVKLRVNNAQVAAQLRSAAKTIGDLSTANKQLSISLYRWTLKNFNSQGREEGGRPWAPLAESTKKRKKKLGKTQPLVITGNLRQSFAGFSNSKQAGVGAKASSFKGRRGDYAVYLHEGTSKMPGRNLLPTEEVATDLAIKVYGLHISKAVQKASSR